MTNDEIHFEKDRRLVPFLLACSPLVSLTSTKNEKGVILFGFSPASTALQLISDFFTDKCPPMSPRKLFEAIDEFRTILYREKDRFRMLEGQGKKLV